MTVVTDKIQHAMNHYPEVADLIELAAHFDETHPIHRICAYVATLTADLLDNLPETETNDNGNAD